MSRPRISILNPALKIEDFDSGNFEVNDFLKNKAHMKQMQKKTAVYTIHLDHYVIAYSALFCTHFCLLLSDQVVPFRVPGLFIGQLGVDRKYQGKDLGKLLIEHAVALANEMSQKVGCRIVFLEAVDEKWPYYAKLNFKLIEQRKNRNKMYLDLLYV
jgi:GNAT superfamily N-acetyltransferase